jgi:hypothetical protein
MADRQIHPLNKSGVESSREAQSLQGGLEICQCPQAHYVRDLHQLAPPVTFLHLAVDQTCLHLPPTCFPTSTTQCKPVSKMGREGIEVQV